MSPSITALCSAAQHESPATEAQIRTLVAEILTREEFQPPSRGITDWLGDRVKDVLEWIGDLFDLSAIGRFSVPIQILYALALALLLVGLVLAVRRLRRDRRPRVVTLPSEQAQRAARAARLLEQARAAAESGDLVLASRHYFWALVIGLSERGAIEYRDSWTCREALARGAPAAEVAALLRPLVPRLDAVSFGHADVAASDVSELALLCERWLPGVRS